MVSTRAGRVRGRRGIRGAGLAVAASALWFGWFAWDDEYQTDPVTQIASGPYEVWQIAGVVATISALAWVGTRWAGAAATISAVTAGFVAAWIVTQAPRDATGLWLVGALLVSAGVASLTGLVAVLVRSRSRRRGIPVETSPTGGDPARHGQPPVP